MSTRAPVPLLLLAASVLLWSTGCKSAYSGRWKGVCDVGLGTQYFSMPVSLELVDTKGTTLAGVGQFAFNESLFEGEARGRIVDDDLLDVDVVGVYGGYTISVAYELELGTEDLEGTCSFVDQRETYEGDVTFQPVAD